MSSVRAQFQQIRKDIDETVVTEMESRAVRGSNELRTAAREVLRGQGGGRRYRVPGTGAYYTASAPGAPPAMRTGDFRRHWIPSAGLQGHKGGNVFVSAIENSLMVGTKKRYLLGELLEDGTSKMAPRPHHDRIRDQARPGIVRIYNEPYF